MRKVWKYRIVSPAEEESIPLPPEADVVHFDIQNGDLTMWVLLDPSYAIADYKNRHFTVLGTGWEVPSDLHYLQSAQQPPFVWHLFERCPAVSETAL